MPSALHRPKNAQPHGDEPWVEQAFALRDAMSRGEIPDTPLVPPLPSPEAPHGDRRGRLRPNRLVSLRSRLHGRAVSRSFRAVDGVSIGLTLVAVVEMSSPGGLFAASVGSVSPFLLGALLLVWGLGVLKGYDFAPREGLARHLVRVAGAFGITAAGLAAVLVPLRPPVVSLDAMGAWFCASFLAIYALHTTWWLMARHWRRNGKLTPNIVIVGATPAQLAQASRPGWLLVAACGVVVLVVALVAPGADGPTRPPTGGVSAAGRSVAGARTGGQPAGD